MDDIDYLFIVLVVTAVLGSLGLGLTLWQYSKLRKKKSPAEPKITSDLQDTSQNHISEKSNRIEPMLDDTMLSELGFSSLEAVLAPANTPETSAAKSTAEKAQQTSAQQQNNEDLIVFYAMAPAGRPYTGYELLQALADVNLHYGKLNIFHYLDRSPDRRHLFSVASAVEPGEFDLTEMGSISCPGLCFFMSPKKVDDPLATCIRMFSIAQQLVEELGGALFDQNRQPLSEEDIEAYCDALEPADTFAERDD